MADRAAGRFPGKGADAGGCPCRGPAPWCLPGLPVPLRRRGISTSPSGSGAMSAAIPILVAPAGPQWQSARRGKTFVLEVAAGHLRRGRPLPRWNWWSPASHRDGSRDPLFGSGAVLEPDRSFPTHGGDIAGRPGRPTRHRGDRLERVEKVDLSGGSPAACRRCAASPAAVSWMFRSAAAVLATATGGNPFRHASGPRGPADRREAACRLRRPPEAEARTATDRRPSPFRWLSRPGLLALRKARRR